MPYESRVLSAEEISIFRDCFNEYDQDRGGNISTEEFGRVMRKTNPSVSDEEVAKIISEVDLDGDGTINFDEFITMMTGQPYKSPPEQAAATETGTDKASAEEEEEEGMPPPPPLLNNPCTSPSSSIAAIRGVSTLSAKLQRQRLANQVYKDAWLATEPTLTGSITPRELLDKVAPAVPGLSVEEADVVALVDPEDAGRGITYERFLEFAKRQVENDDIFSDYGA